MSKLIDIKLNDNVLNGIQESSPLRSLIDQLTMLFFTTPGDVLGQPEMGLNLKQYLFELNFSNFEVERYIKRQIDAFIYWSKFFQIDVKVKLIKGDINDVGFVDVAINGINSIGVYIK